MVYPHNSKDDKGYDFIDYEEMFCALYLVLLHNMVDKSRIFILNFSMITSVLWLFLGGWQLWGHTLKEKKEMPGFTCLNAPKYLYD